MQRRPCIVIALASLLLAACNHAPTDSAEEDLRQRLAGTWLREFEEGGIHVRRVLVLEPDGQFLELARITDAGGAVTEHSHAGQWLYDGTNLKRKYTRMDGRQPAAPTMPFAPFELRFQSRNEFIGIDNVRRREVRYLRVPQGTLP